MRTTEDILFALAAAYENAEHPANSKEEQCGHRSGVRDVAVRLGLYDEFCKFLKAGPLYRPNKKAP